jgi:hypothetical protein
MNVNLSIDTTLTLGHYVFEVGFWLKDWQFSKAVRVNGAIRVLHVGPLCFCVTDMKKLMDGCKSEPQRISLDELLDL